MGKYDNAIFLDIETTGLKPSEDELLKLTIMRYDKSLIFKEMFNPQHNGIWPEAEAVNHISPKMVMKCKPFSFYKDTVQQILNHADYIVGFNVNFDVAFLEHAGVTVPRKRLLDIQTMSSRYFDEFFSLSDCYDNCCLEKDEEPKLEKGPEMKIYCFDTMIEYADKAQPPEPKHETNVGPRMRFLGLVIAVAVLTILGIKACGR